MVRLQGHTSNRSENAGPALKKSACNNDWRLLVADTLKEAARKKAMALKTNIPKKGAVR
jgi:hypothetical protein